MRDGNSAAAGEQQDIFAQRRLYPEHLIVELFQLVLVLGALHVERFHNFFFKQLSE